MEYDRRIYQIVRKIPSGKVATYGQIARLLGNPGLARVVGNVLHVNPDGDYTPCFRVVNSQGKLAAAYVFGGSLEQKRHLLEDGVEVVNDRVDLTEYGWDGRIPYLSLNNYLKQTYGRKMYKVSLDGGFTCPNRDGHLGYDGCIFCSQGGSGDFAANRSLSIAEQIQEGKKLIEKKLPKRGSLKDSVVKDSVVNDSTVKDSVVNDLGTEAFINGSDTQNLIAYFQAFTGTYGPIDVLRQKYEEAIRHPEVAIVSIATRPDCLSEEVLDLLTELSQIKPIWVELGLQTMHEETARYIRRGYPLEVYENAFFALRSRNIPVITHVILGLPGETKKQMLQTIEYVGAIHSDGIKIQLLHVLKGTDLAKEYEAGKFQCLEMDAYLDLVQEALAILPPEMVIHRLTGDGDKRTLIAPKWSENKKFVLGELEKRCFATTFF